MNTRHLPTRPGHSAEPGGLTRRGALGVLALASAALAGTHGTAAASQAAASGTRPLPELAPIPEGAVDLADFAPHEQRIAQHLKSLVELANSVEDEDPATYGFITGDFWRTPKNEPFNSRVQENVLTMAYFHGADRPWNPKHADPALLARTEAALRYWLGLQNPDGSFAEGEPGERSTAATGFALLFLGHLLTEVRPPLGPGLREEVLATVRRAMRWFLDPGNRIVWVERLAYSNQIVGGLAGTAVLLPVLEDRGLRTRLEERLRYLERHAQSPAGFYYENDEVDHGYSYTVMSRDLGILYRATRSATVRRMQRRFYDWVLYHQLWEPDGSGVFVNNAVSGRTGGFARDADAADGLATLWAPVFPRLNALLATEDEVAARRAEFAAGDWASLPALGEGRLGPEPVVAVAYPESPPSTAQRAAAVADLPYVRSETFTEYRADPAKELDFCFVRRPGLYLGMSFGRRSRATGMSYPSHRRGGPSFLWHPRMGTVVYGTNGDQGRNEAVWSTVTAADGVERSDAAQDLEAVYRDAAGGHRVDPRHLRARQDFHVDYRPPGGWMTKRLSVLGSAVHLRVEVHGGFTERVPFALLPTDVLTWVLEGGGTAPAAPGGTDTRADATGLRVRRDGDELDLTWHTPLPARLADTGRDALTRRPRALHGLELECRDRLHYALHVR